MKVQVVGVQKFNFTGNNGNAVNGVKLHFLYAVPYVVGSACDVLTVMDSAGVDVSDIRPEGIYNFDFDMKGKLVAIYPSK